KPRRVAYLALIVALSVGIQAEHYTENLTTYGFVVASPAEMRMHTTGGFSLRFILTNALRGVAIHANAPPGRLHLAADLHRLANTIDPSGPHRSPPVDWRFTSTHEDLAGAPVHFLLALGILAAVVLAAPGTYARRSRAYALAALVGALTLCVAIRWN